MAEGASLADILAADAHTLATAIARAEGLAPVVARDGRPHLPGLVARALASGTAMGALLWFFALDPVADFFYTHPSPGALLTSLVTSYGTCGALTLAAAASGMTFYLRGCHDTRGTVALASAAMAVTGSVGVGVCVGMARLIDHSGAAVVVLVYVPVVAGAMTAGIAAAWRWRPPTAGPRHAPAPGRPRTAGRWLRQTAADAEPHRIALAATGVLGAIVGYLLLLALVGGRHDFVGQCYLQADGLTTCMDSVPRSYWVDVTAAGVGALVAVVATYVVARRPRTPEGLLHA